MVFSVDVLTWSLIIAAVLVENSVYQLSASCLLQRHAPNARSALDSGAARFHAETVVPNLYSGSYVRYDSSPCSHSHIYHSGSGVYLLNMPYFLPFVCLSLSVPVRTHVRLWCLQFQLSPVSLLSSIRSLSDSWRSRCCHSSPKISVTDLFALTDLLAPPL